MIQWPKVDLMAAADLNLGIGKDNQLPWKIPKEFAYFLKMTNQTSPGKQPAIIMGRKTWNENMPFREEFFKNCIVLVVSRTLEQLPGVYVCRAYEDALKILSTKPLSDTIYRIWNIGGSEIYRLGLDHPSFNRLYLSKIHKAFDCDTFFPKIDLTTFRIINDPDVLQGIQEDNNIQFETLVYSRLDIVSDQENTKMIENDKKI